MECGNCGFFNHTDQLICAQCAAAVQTKQPHRSSYALFILLASMIAFATLAAWLQI